MLNIGFFLGLAAAIFSLKNAQAKHFLDLLEEMEQTAQSLIEEARSAREEKKFLQFSPPIGGDNLSPTPANSSFPRGKKNVSLVYFKDIIGIESILKEATEVVDYLRDPFRYQKLGARMPRGILLEGPPGNGKTMIAKAIATEAHCKFIEASGSSFINKYIGTGAANVRQLFAQARSSRQAIIFIDEFDAVAGLDRGKIKDDGPGQEYKQTINQLLTELDGFASSESIIVIAATNNAASLDPAVKRSGRFDRIIHVPLPDESARKKLLLHYLSKLPKVGNDIEEAIINKIAKESDSLCAADFKNMVNEMAIFAVREGSEAVCMRHVVAGAVKVIKTRIKEKEMNF